MTTSDNVQINDAYLTGETISDDETPVVVEQG